MAEKPYALKGEREVQATPVSDSEVQLRHLWLTGAPPWTYAALLGFATVSIMLIGGWPGSWEAAAFQGGLLALVAYPLAALCYNHTTLTVTADTLRWRYGPLPWRPGARISRDRIAAITFGRIHRTLSSEEFTEQQRSGYTPRPRYAETLRTHRWPRERRIFDLIGDEATAAAVARFLGETLGEIPVENCRQRNRAELPEWGYAVNLLGLVGFVALLLFSVFSDSP